VPPPPTVRAPEWPLRRLCLTAQQSSNGSGTRSRCGIASAGDSIWITPSMPPMRGRLSASHSMRADTEVVACPDGPPPGLFAALMLISVGLAWAWPAHCAAPAFAPPAPPGDALRTLMAVNAGQPCRHGGLALHQGSALPWS